MVESPHAVKRHQKWHVSSLVCRCWQEFSLHTHIGRRKARTAQPCSRHASQTQGHRHMPLGNGQGHNRKAGMSMVAAAALGVTWGRHALPLFFFSAFFLPPSPCPKSFLGENGMPCLHECTCRDMEAGKIRQDKWGMNNRIMSYRYEMEGIYFSCYFYICYYKK